MDAKDKNTQNKKKALDFDVPGVNYDSKLSNELEQLMNDSNFKVFELTPEINTKNTHKPFK